MKHIGKMKNNGAKILVAYRTLPGDSNNALVIGTNALGDSYHDALMVVVQEDRGQQANELADILAVRRFPDGNIMLSWLHSHGHLKKVATNAVIMVPNTQATIALDELNVIIAGQRGCTVDELAVTDGAKANAKTLDKSVGAVPAVNTEAMSAVEMRSRADTLFAEAQALRKSADVLDPPKPKNRKAAVVVEQ